MFLFIKLARVSRNLKPLCVSLEIRTGLQLRRMTEIQAPYYGGKVYDCELEPLTLSSVLRNS